MRKAIHYILLLMASSLLVFTGCDVHEFPEKSLKRTPFVLHLNFDTEMPLHKEIYYTRSEDTKDYSESFDIRYIINAYRNDGTKSNRRAADTTFVFTKSDINNPNYSAQLELYEGDYTFYVWSDYVLSGTADDKYYLTNDFSEIILANQYNHPGSNDFRDAFKGSVTATVMNPEYYAGEILETINNEATVEMLRPMGKYKFITTDIDIFITRVEQMIQQGKLDFYPSEGADSKPVIDIKDFDIVFKYQLFMPCSFDMFADGRADSWSGMSFVSTMQKINDTEVQLGFDYLFTDTYESPIGIYLEVYTKDGKFLSSTDVINVPIMRGKLTIVKGAFLTSKASGGITINPGFDDEYNIPID